MMLDKLDGVKAKYEEIASRLSDPSILADQAATARLLKESSSLEPVVREYEAHLDILRQIDNNKSMLEESDGELKELVLEDLASLNTQLKESEERLTLLMLPKDPNDEKNVMVEIRAGVGGDEAALFAGDLARMYMRFAERRRWKTEILSSSEVGVGGYKEIIFMINGAGAYSRLKYESGAHRVQRVPETESSGRIHTSAATVAVLAEAKEVEINVAPGDVRVDVFRSSGNGGQSVNTTDSAVRVTHIPTGIVISCQDEKSQLKNRDKAMRILNARLLELERRRQSEEIARDRKSQVGSGDRSERIRTYNFPQGRVTDHRVNLTLHRLTEVLDGDLDALFDALALADQAERMQEGV